MDREDIDFADGRGQTLAEALGVAGGEVVALVGAGGKTTAMYRLAAELAALGGRVLVTTTTHIYPPSPQEVGTTVLDGDLERLLGAVCAALDRHPIVAVARGLSADGKLMGIDPEWVGELRDRAPIASLLVEADGAAGRAFKAPAPHEPVIPTSAELVVPVVGLSVLGRPLLPEFVHRPERVAALAGVRLGDMVSPNVIAGVLLHPGGSTRGASSGARIVPLLNQADGEERLRGGRLVARELVRRGARRVVIAVAGDATPVREVLVATSAVGPLTRRNLEDRRRDGCLVL